MIKFFLFIWFVLFINITNAQTLDGNSVKFGIRGGVNLSHINFARGAGSPVDPINTNWQPGIIAGGLILVPVYGNLYFQPEYLFSQIGGKIENENRQYYINYVSLPVLLNWHLLDKFSLLAGPQFDLLINGRDKTPGYNRSIEREIEHRHLGITGGLEYFFTGNAVLDIRFIYGINNIGIDREAGYQEFQTEILQFSFIYLF